MHGALIGVRDLVDEVVKERTVDMAVKIKLAVICVMLGCAASASAQQRSDVFGRSKAGDSASGSSWLRPGQEARSLLRKHVDSVDWEDVTFEEIIDWLRDQGDDQVNILPRMNALSVESVDNDSLVTLKLRNSRVATILNEALDQLSETGEVTYQGHGNILKISTKTDFGRKLEVRTYEILDLLFKAPDMGQSFPSIDLQRASRSGGGGGGQSIFGGGGSSGSEELDEDESEVEERIIDLMTVISQNIEPASWGPIAGLNVAIPGTGVGSMTQFNNRQLVIRNTVTVHELIAGHFSLGK